MFFLPIENFIYKTKLSSKEIISLLKKNVEPRKVFRILKSSDLKPYEGYIEKNSFKIIKIDRYTYVNNLPKVLPELRGVIKNNTDNNTIIKVKMRLPSWKMQLPIWLIKFLLLAYLPFIFFLSPTYLNFASVFLLIYLLMLALFKYQSNQAKKFLTELFKAESIEK